MGDSLVLLALLLWSWPAWALVIVKLSSGDGMRLEAYTLIEPDMRAAVAAGWKVVRQEGSGWIMRWPFEHWPPNPRGRYVVEVANKTRGAKAPATARKRPVHQGDDLPANARNRFGPSGGEAQEQMR